MSPRHILVQAIVRIISCLNQAVKHKSKTQWCTLPFKSHSTTTNITSISLATPVSLSHSTTASILSPTPRPHASPRLLSTTTIKSNEAMRACVRAWPVCCLSREGMTKSQGELFFRVVLTDSAWPYGCEASCLSLCVFA